jgi:hypothetical protein
MTMSHEELCDAVNRVGVVVERTYSYSTDGLPRAVPENGVLLLRPETAPMVDVRQVLVCVRCRRVDQSASPEGSRTLYSVSCACGRGVSSFAYEEALSMWATRARDRAAADSSAAASAEMLAHASSEVLAARVLRLGRLRSILENYLGGPNGEPRVEDAHEFLMQIRDLVLQTEASRP